MNTLVPKEETALEAPDPGEALESGAMFKAQLGRWHQLLQTGLLPKSVDTPQKALVIAMKGAELGWAPMESLAKLHVINGKVEMSAEAMLGEIYRAHPTATIDVVEHTDTICKVLAKRHPEDVAHEVTFTIEEAKRARLTGKPVWNQYPKAMLWARAISQVRRWKFPDVAGSAYVEGEVDRTQHATVSQIPDDEIVDAVTNGAPVEAEEIEE